MNWLLFLSLFSLISCLGSIPGFGQSIASASSWDTLFFNAGYPDGPVYAIATHKGITYLGGNFSHVGNKECHNIAAWDGKNWLDLDTGNFYGTDGPIYAIAIDSLGRVYIGGKFNQVGKHGAINIARWDGSSWSSIDNGPDQTVWALCSNDSQLAVGGDFTHVGTNTANHIALYNYHSDTWLPLVDSVGVNGVNGSVRAIKFDSELLLAGGMFTTAGANSHQYFGGWSKNKWSFGFGDRINGPVHSIEKLGAGYAIGGEFTTPGPFLTFYYSPYKELSTPITLNGPVYAMAARNSSTLVLGGNFTIVDNAPAEGLAIFQGNVWAKPVHTLMIPPLSHQGSVYAVSSDSNSIFLGGELNWSNHMQQNIGRYLTKAPVIDLYAKATDLCNEGSHRNVDILIINRSHSTDTLIFWAGYDVDGFDRACCVAGHLGGIKGYYQTPQKLAPGDSIHTIGSYDIGTDPYTGERCDCSFSFRMVSNATNITKETWTSFPQECPPPDISGSLVISRTIKFGTRPALASVTLEHQGTNNGNRPIRILSYSISPEFDFVDTSQHIIEPYGTLRFSVHHTFEQADWWGKSIDGEVIIVTDDSSGPVYTLAISGRSVSSECTPRDSSVVLGEVLIGTDSLLTITFEPLYINSQQFKDIFIGEIKLEGSESFSIDPSWQPAPKLGSELATPIHFHPIDTSSQLATLTVHAGDRDHHIYLTGKGVNQYSLTKSIEESNDPLTIIPNPARNNFTITSNSVIHTIKLYNLLGQELPISISSMNTPGNRIYCTIEQLPPGIYTIVTTTSKGSILSQKIEVR